MFASVCKRFRARGDLLAGLHLVTLEGLGCRVLRVTCKGFQVENASLLVLSMCGSVENHAVHKVY